MRILTPSSVSCVGLWIGLSLVPGSFALDQTLRILPLGDSITQGVYPQQSYRYRLWKKLIDEEVSFEFVGSRTRNYDGTPSFPPYQGRTFDRHHEGHSGWRTQDIYDGCTEDDSCRTKNEGYLAQWLTDYTPDLVLIHLGTNDIFQNASTLDTLISLRLIVDTLRRDNPEVIILLAQIFPISGSRYSKVRSLNAQIAAAVPGMQDPQSPVLLVDMFTDVDPLVHSYDGIHPNSAGEEIMAQRWTDAILDSMLPNQPPVVDAGPDRTVRFVRDQVNLAAYVVDDGRPYGIGELAFSWWQSSGPAPATLAQPLWGITDVVFPEPGIYSFGCVATDGDLATFDSVEFVVEDYTCPPTYRAIGGRVVLEAHRHVFSTPGLGPYAAAHWETVRQTDAADGWVARALPDVAKNTGEVFEGPRLDYWIEFEQPGTYFLWARLRGLDATDNSIHAGFDGVPLTDDSGGLSTTVWDTWQWIGKADDAPVAITVDSPGTHTLSILMREDGVMVDRLLLTTHPQDIPTGIGPAASPLVDSCDFDRDQMDDLWEFETFTGIGRDGTEDLDDDGLIDQEEYVAGTDPRDEASYPRVVAITGPPPTISFPTSIGRVYVVEGGEVGSADITWTPFEQRHGTGNPISVPVPVDHEGRLFRYRAELP